MSSKIPLSEYHKELAEKYRISMDKENVHSVQNMKSEGKNEGKKKGLMLSAGNCVVRTTSVKSSYVGKSKFQIYHDDNDERSRPRVRKDVCRKEIRARRDREFEKKIVSTTKVAEEKIASDLRTVPRRARSSSNCRHRVPLDKAAEMNSKLFKNRRSYSDSRKFSLQQPSDIQKAKHLTIDVKKRTLSSIQMWREKMRKSHTGTVPKNIATNAPNVDKTNVKIKLRKNSAVGSMDLQLEMPQNQATELKNNNIEQVNSSKDLQLQMPQNQATESNNDVEEVNSLKDVLRYVSNEIAVFLQNQTYLTLQGEISTRSSTSTKTQNVLDNNLTTITNSALSVTPLDGPLSLPLTPMKVRYEKRVTIGKSSMKKEDELDIIALTPYERDYLEDVPNAERIREENAPRLSSRFLRENINAEQRRIIVRYIIRLGAHYNHSSHVIYQTIKLFNVAIDRILVEMNDIQLIALACLWIIVKRDAPAGKIPSATAILQLAKDLYTDQEKYLLMFESKILSAVKFNTRFADPFSLLSYYILNVNRDSRCIIIKPNDILRVFFCGSYMIDVSMLDESLCDIPACVIAIAATELALCFVYSSDINMNEAWLQVWRNKQSLTGWEERVKNSTKQIMIQRAQKYNRSSSSVIYKKYMLSKYGGVTYFLCDKLMKIVI